MPSSPVLRTALLASALAAVAVASPIEADGPFQFHSLSPCRVFDTRQVGEQTNGIVPLASVGSPTAKDLAVTIGMIGSGTVLVLLDVTGYLQ